MAELTPSDVTNLDGYGAEALPWSRPFDLLAARPLGPEIPFFLGTVRPDGRPHSVGIGAVYHDGDLYFTAGPGTRKARNLAGNPSCTISVRLETVDLTMEGTAARVLDTATLEALAGVYRDGGWPAEVDGDALTAPFSAPSAGPPPWQLYRFTVDTAVGVATTEPSGATKWTFRSAS